MKKNLPKLTELLLDISSSFINLPLSEIGKTIQDSLEKLGEFVLADRCYIFDYDFEKQICINTYEWCRKGIVPQINALLEVPLSMIPFWVETHLKGEEMYVPDVQAVPSGGFREILEPQEIKSLLAVPMMLNHKCVGFIGFDYIRNHHDFREKEKQLLKIFSNILVNITERKKNEELLRMSEIRYDQVISMISTIIWSYEIDAEGRFVRSYMSPVAENLLGLPAGILGNNFDKFYSYVHPDDYNKVSGALAARLDSPGRNISVEYRLIIPDGKVLWLYSVGVSQLRSDGHIIAFGSTTDITERKLAEEALHKSEIITTSIVNSIPVGMHIYQLEPDGRLIFTGANPAANQILGIDNSVFVGKTIEEAFPPLTETEVPERYREVAEKGTYWHTENIEYQDNKISGAYEVFAFQIGQNSMVAAFKDISERKKAELEILKVKEKAEASEARFKAISEQAMDGITLADTNGDYVFVNPAFCNMIGYSESELVRMNIRDLIPVAGTNTLFDQVKQKGIGYRKGALLQRKDKSLIYIDINGCYLKIENEDLVLGVVRNVTDHVKAEQEIIRRKEIAEENEKELKKAQRTAHVGNWKWYIQENRLWWSDEIYRIFDIDKETFNGELSGIIEESIHPDDRKAVEESNYSVMNYNKPVALEYRILWKDGTTRYVYAKADEMILDENRKAAIFNRFEQADIKDSKAYQGSGLGLSIAKSYVEMLGGNIWVESEVGKGSMFHFTLPYAYAPPSKDIKTINPVRPLTVFNNIKILVAEDDELSYLLLKEILNSENIITIHAQNGTDTIKFLRQNHDISLIVMDIRMPGLNGLDTTREIRKFNKTIPIIALSAYALLGDRESAIEAGCNDYLSKPVNQKDLLNIIRKYVEMKDSDYP